MVGRGKRRSQAGVCLGWTRLVCARGWACGGWRAPQTRKRPIHFEAGGVLQRPADPAAWVELALFLVPPCLPARSVGGISERVHCLYEAGIRGREARIFLGGGRWQAAAVALLASASGHLSGPKRKGVLLPSTVQFGP